MSHIPHHSRDHVTVGEIHDALVTGTRPVYFQTTENDYIWGSGTLFITQWKNHQYAITAKHVIENLDADPKTLRIFFPEYDIALPVNGASTPSHPNHEYQKEVEDMMAFHIIKEPNLGEHNLEWHAWNMNKFWMPASELAIGQQLFAIGYPSEGRSFDYENKTVSETPLISIGKLSQTSIGKDLYTIECNEFSTDLNGISGGPVFARFNGLFHYVGMILKAGAKAQRIHFVNSIYITFLLEEASKFRSKRDN